MKIIIKLISILAILLSLSACKTTAKDSVYKDASTGNTSGNINNNSVMLEFDGWVYYSIGSIPDSPTYITEDDGLYRMRPNGTEKQKINDMVASAMHISGDAIYFSSNFKLFKTKLSDLSTEPVNLLASIVSVRMIAVHDRMIISNNAVNNLLYSMKNDGSDLVKLSASAASCADFNKGWVYYITEEPLTLHRVYIDGTQDAIVSTDVGNDFMIVNDTIYYSSLADEYKLYAMSLTGEKPTKITETAVASLNSDGNQIFYIDSITRKVHMLSFNGKVDTQISYHVANRISIAGGWVYYSDNQIPTQIFRISLSNWTEETFYSRKKDIPAISEVENKGMAISNDNFYSGGSFAQSGEWIYSSILQGDAIFKIHADGSNKTKIYDVHADNLAILGEWIYFINKDQDMKIYRVKTDGSELTLVFDVPTLNFLVNDEWIYLTTKADGGVIKIKTNGEDRVDLFYLPNDYPSLLFGIANDKVYRDDSGKVVEMDFSGNTTATVDTEEWGIVNVILHNDWIFFVVPSYSGDPTVKLCKIKRDGTSKTLVETIPQGGDAFGFYEDWLYFTTNLKTEALVRLNVETGKREILYSGKAFTHLFFLDGKIIAIRATDVSTEMFISDLDGSNQATFSY